MKFIALFEIFLMIGLTFAVSFSLNESQDVFSSYPQESYIITKLRTNLLGVMDNNLVSAESLSTCFQNVNGTYCQEYPSEICNFQCNSECFPGRANEMNECRLGTCVDPREGTCSPNTPQLLCTQNGGSWSEREPAECNPGCCLIGGQAQYTTERACQTIGEREGVQVEFQSVENEAQCLAMAEEQDEGACVFEKEFENNCKFTTKAECITMQGSFHKDYLCSNPELKTVCEKQKTTSCIDGKDGVYWLDSCGNRENIYDSNKVKSWNNGKVLAPSESCELGTESNPFSNQNSCGNCDYLLGSVCGTPREKDAKPLEGDYICRDLSCEDEWGNERKQGESWCRYEGQIGVDNEDDKNKGRSTDIPGSRHYREVCIDGDVRTETCADYRNGICIESRNEEIDFSSAACVINQWQSCTEANTDKTKLDKCEENSACYLKNVRLDSFRFDVCVPRYPPGFDLKQELGGEVGQSICNIGSQKCKQVWVKKFSGWSCEANCKCSTPEFTETMNNLCISLGDCGGHVNLEGTFTTGGYSVKGAPKLGSNYINGLKEYTEPIEGQYADPPNLSETAALFGLDPNDPEFNDKMGEIIGELGLGSTGVLLAAGYLSGGFVGYSLGELIATTGQGAFALNLGAYSGVAAGASIGAAMGFIIGKLLGLQGDAMLAVTVVGVAAGAYFGVGILSGGASASPGALFGSFLIPVIIIIIIVALIMKFLGIGDTKIKTISFSCLPWQPPSGGTDCSKCGENGLPCSKYKCQSMGQTCEFLNEGTSEEICADSSPNDASAPVISPNYGAVEKPFVYNNVNERGFSVEHESLECIPAYTQVNFGISLNEPGQCKYDTVHSDSFEEMEFFFGESSLYSYNHTTAISLPSLDSLGGSRFDPDSRADFNLYVRCSDGNGNENVQEYAINFCVSPEDDITAPVIGHFEPASPKYVATNATQEDVSFYTNEPAECKYDTIDTSYDLMKGTAQCENDLGEMTLYGWACNATLSAGSNKTSYYFRCLDQPLGEERNSNSQSTIYELIRSQSPLEIVSISPSEETISAGEEPTSVTLEVKTKGGAPGNRFCEFNLGNGFIRFFESGTDNHKQKFSSLFGGNYNIPIRCKDEAGNTANGVSVFELNIDTQGPEITRVYDQSGKLYVVTNEPSECAISSESCGFIFENGTIMSGVDLLHSIDFESTRTNYVKCKDRFDTTGMCFTIRGGY